MKYWCVSCKLATYGSEARIKAICEWCGRKDTLRVYHPSYRYKAEREIWENIP